MSDRFPTLDAYRSATGTQLVVWCDHEQMWHTHGRHDSRSGACALPSIPRQGQLCTCPTGTGDGHRVAHCSCPSSPFQTSGYSLREVGTWTKETRRGRPDRAAPRCGCKR